MSYCSRRNWPPQWVWAGGKEEKPVRGEIGVLREVRRPEADIPKVFIAIEHDGCTYLARLLFDDCIFSTEIFELLNKSVGRSLQDIGGTELVALTPPDRKTRPLEYR